MYKFQLKDARNSLALKSISGLCTDSDEFVAVLNEAMERLLDRGGWFGTEFIIRMCMIDGCVTWPRQVGTVLGIRFACAGNFEIRNNWYQILGPRGGSFDGGGDWAIFDHTMVDNGTAPCYGEITGTTGKYLRVYPTKLEDVGKTVTFYGVDPGLQPLQQKINGDWHRGLTLTLASPYVQSSQLVQRITSVTKEVTQANVLLYEFDSTTQTLRDMALWEPTETNPQFRRSIVRGFNCLPTPGGCAATNGVTPRRFEALAKLEFIPVLKDEDFLAIDNWTALKFAIQAIRLEEANQDDLAETKFVKAVRELNFRDRTKNPSQQGVWKVNPVGRSIYSPI